MSWQRVRQEFERLCELQPEQRTAHLAELAATDAWLAGQLRDLFAEEAARPSFLDRVPTAVTTDLGFATVGLRLGRFELVRPLGSGGMGAVWEARQLDPERRVAIKLVVRTGQTEAERWRFRHEVQVLAQLNHPAIATLLEAGEDDLGGVEVAWFAMELVEHAADLLAWAKQRALLRDDRIALFEQLCEAVDYGHRRGVLHRDLKPGNVLVSGDGRLKLIDFGVARALGGDQAEPGQRTATGQIVGTLQYMAPEQLRLDLRAIGQPCDVYALGVMLFHLLCDAPPFDFAAVPFARIAAIVLEQEPQSPFALRPDLPRDLGWIVLRALAKDPEHRYATVRELIDDLHRWRTHEPVRARAPSRAYRLHKFLRRHRVAVAVATTLTLGLGIGATFLVRGLQEARSGQHAAQRGTALAREVSRVTVGLFDAIDDTERSRDIKVHQLLDAGKFEPGTMHEPVVEFVTRDLRGRIYARLHRFAEARYELDRAAELRAAEVANADGDVFPQEGREVFDARYGQVLAASGERERGERMLRAAVATADTAGSPRARLEVQWYLCEFLSGINAFDELAESAAELQRRAEQQGDRRLARKAQAMMAQAATFHGQHGDAVRLAEACWRGMVELYGPDAEAVCGPLADYVRTLQEAGRNDEAEVLYPQLIEATRRVYGPTHDHTLTVLNNHCALLRERGKTKELLDGLRDIVRCYEARGGEATESQLIATNNLGMTLNQMSSFDEAEPYLRRAGELSSRLFDARDPNGPMLRFNHAACLAWLKRWDQAEPALLREYHDAEKLLPADHAVLGKMRRTLADAYKVNGQPDEAARWRQPK